MKLNASIISCLALAAAGGAAFADATTDITSTTVGVLKTVVSAGTDAPLGVPYLGSDSNSVAVADLITVGLAKDDEISVWDGSTYKIWKYTGSAWEGAADANHGVAATEDDATATKVQPGQAIWYKPASATAVVLAGVVPASSSASATANASSLFCNPYAEAVTVKDITNASKGDQIFTTTTKTRYVYTTCWNTVSWTEYTTIGGQTRQKESLTAVSNTERIPAGEGFWYLSNGGTPTITWKAAE